MRTCYARAQQSAPLSCTKPSTALVASITIHRSYVPLKFARMAGLTKHAQCMSDGNVVKANDKTSATNDDSRPICENQGCYSSGVCQMIFI